MKIDEKRLYQLMESFSRCTGVPVTFFDSEGVIQREFLLERKFCGFFERYRRPSDCTKNLLLSGKLSFELGEAYIFSCPADLVNIGVPIILDEKYCGCVVAGPLMMGSGGEKVLKKALDLNADMAVNMSKIAYFLPQMTVYDPVQIQDLSVVLYNTVLSCHKNWGEYDQISARNKRQVESGNRLQRYKQRQEPALYSTSTYSALETQLLSAAQARQRERAMDLLAQLHEETLLIEGGHFDNVKMRVFELFVTLSRLAASQGASLQKIFGMDFDIISSLNGLETLDNLFHWSEAVVLHFMENVYTPRRHGHSECITQTLAYIDEHYMEKITLRTLSKGLYMNESSLSKLFRQEVGLNFTDYLNNTRIDHAIALMDRSELSLLEVAVQVGFEDQSYFTKVFKKTKGVTPRQYKQDLAREKRGTHD